MSARVSGHGARRKLTWRIADLAGHAVRFVEEGAGSSRAARRRPPRARERLVRAGAGARAPDDRRRSSSATGCRATRQRVGTYAAPRPRPPARPRGLKVAVRGAQIVVDVAPGPRRPLDRRSARGSTTGATSCTSCAAGGSSFPREKATRGRISVAGWAPPKSFGRAVVARFPKPARRRPRRG